MNRSARFASLRRPAGVSPRPAGGRRVAEYRLGVLKGGWLDADVVID
jgi:hypothetical protein